MQTSQAQFQFCNPASCQIPNCKSALGEKLPKISKPQDYDMQKIHSLLKKYAHYYATDIKNFKFCAQELYLFSIMQNSSNASFNINKLKELYGYYLKCEERYISKREKNRQLSSYFCEHEERVSSDMAENMNTLFARISSAYQLLLSPRTPDEKRKEILSQYSKTIYPSLCELETLLQKIDSHEIEFAQFGSDFMLKLRGF